MKAIVKFGLLAVLVLVVTIVAQGDRQAVAGQAKDVWVADYDGNRVVKLSPDGSRICEFNDIPGPFGNPNMIGPSTLAVNPADGSVWVACTPNDRVFKLSSQCEEQFELYGPPFQGEMPSSPAIDENGDAWIALPFQKKEIIKLDQDTGAKLLGCKDSFIGGSEYPIAIAIDHVRHKLWVTEAAMVGTGHVVRFSYTANTCTLDQRWPGFNANWLDVDPINGYCWVADTGKDRVAKISPAGAISYFYGAFNKAFKEPRSVSVDPSTHGPWVADTVNDRVVRLSYSGTDECETSLGLLRTPLAVEVDPTFGTWVADSGHGEVEKLGPTCMRTHRNWVFTTPVGLALDYSGGSQVQLQYTDVGPINEPVVFSFAIITDNHINIAELTEVVNWIDSNISNENIRFVLVTGDITDIGYGGTSDPFIKVKRVLDSLQIPYIPVIGNHDVYYDFNNPPANFEKPTEEIFNQVFSSEYDYLENVVLPHWTKEPTPVWNDQLQTHMYSYFQNFAFDYMRYHLVGSDFVSRSDIFGDESDSGCPELHDNLTDGTWNWFTDHISTYTNKSDENILLFVHHPLSFTESSQKGCNPLLLSFNFTSAQYSKIVSFLASYKAHVDKWFAGHWHICDGALSCQETINENPSNNSGATVLENIVTRSVSPFPDAPGKSLRLVRVHDDLSADFDPTPTSPEVGEYVLFPNTFTGSVSRWEWDFGDGNQFRYIPPPRSPRHAYPKPGVYKVTLTVTQDVSGAKASIAHYVDVGTKQLTSQYPDATAYNNARKLNFDPGNGTLHLIYRWDFCDWEACLTYAKSTDEGETWFEVTNTTLADGTYPGGPLMGLYPASDVDESGKPYIVKVRSFGLADEFDAARREKPLGWFSYDRVSESGSFGHPSAVVDSDDTLHIAIPYDTGTACQIRYYKASPGGLVRISPGQDYEVVVNTPDDCSFASIALDANEKPHVIWQQNSTIYHSRRTTTGWTNPSPISSVTATASTPSIVADGSYLYAVWQEDDRVVYSRYEWEFAPPWLTPEPVAKLSAASVSAYPQVVNRRNVVWQDLDSDGTYDIYHSIRIAPGRWRTPPENISDTSDNSRYPQAAMANNDLHVVWTEETSYEIRHEKIPALPVGGIVEVLVDGSDSLARPAEGSDSSAPPYAFLAGATAAALALAAGGWYARRRWLR